MILEPGSVFAGYTVQRRIGVGGMGSVYLMHHPRLPLDVAVKVLDPALGRDPKARALFHREAEIAARLHHPNIVRVHDRGSEGDHLWLAMDYVDGPDTAQLLRDGPLATELALDIVRQTAAALDYAHQHGVLHRDVKPANLLITHPGNRNLVRITDFGIARTLDDTTTLTTSVRATFAYAAPELLTNSPIDHRVDVYALGATLYRLLSETVPYPRDSLGAIIHAHLSEPPPRLTTDRVDLPSGIDQVIAIALAKEPAERFQTCTALADAAYRALGYPTPRTMANPAVSDSPRPDSAHIDLTPTVASSAARPTDSRPIPTPKPPIITRRRLLIAAGVLPAAAVIGTIPLVAQLRSSDSGGGDEPAGVGAPAVLTGHTGVVHAVAFSPDSVTLATVSFDMTVRLWDIRTSKQIGEPLLGHSDRVRTVAFSSDGATLATTSADTTARFWDIAARQQISQPLTEPNGSINSVEFSPDGSTFVTAGSDGIARIRDIRTWRQTGAPLTGHTGSVNYAAFSPDGKTVATASFDTTIRLWDTRTRQQIGEPLVGHTDRVRTVVFNRDGTMLASTSADTTARLWDVSSRQQIGEPLTVHAGGTRAVAFSPDGVTLVTTGDDSTARLLDVSTRRQIGEPLIGHSDAVYSAAFSADGATLATTSSDKTIRIWDVHRMR